MFPDYIGYIHNVEKVKEYGGATGNKIKLRNIGIRNLKYAYHLLFINIDVNTTNLMRLKFCSNNVVIFTLWNEKADNFEEDDYMRMQKPVVLAVSSCYLKTYGGKYKPYHTYNCYRSLIL